MLVESLKSKIYKAVITQTELDYEGSIAIDSDIIKAADLRPNEKVQVLNMQNGNRFSTYVIPARANSGTIGLNGPAARLGLVGDQVVILSYALIGPSEKLEPVILKLDKNNKITE